MDIRTCLLHSGRKVFPDDERLASTYRGGSFLCNEPYSFQLAYRSVGTVIPVYAEIGGDFPLESIAEYAVQNVPVLQVSAFAKDENFEAHGVGMYPDILMRRQTVSEVVNDGFWQPRYFESGESTLLYALPDCWQSLWFTLNEQGTVPAGRYTVTIRLRSQKDRRVLAENAVDIQVIGVPLPKQTTVYTNWFHYDCLSDLYRVPVFSQRYEDMLRSYVGNAVRHGMNTLLLPAFTPPLDTSVDRERMTVQLVDIVQQGDRYTFDFTRMKHFIELVFGCGIQYLEHSHLFTQWGAKHAPKIVAEVDGQSRRVFGWDTEASGEAYRSFLQQYLAALRRFLADEGLTDRVFFHISDEPCTQAAFASYEQAANGIRDLLQGLKLCDTFSHRSYFDRSYVTTPIVVVPSAPDFRDYDGGYWLYYTGENSRDLYTNRLITTTNGRCRILGVQMYYYGATGFLHWGYNYYYDTLSHGLFDPGRNPCGYAMHPGTSYLVYPQMDGTCLPSMREKLMMEAMCDIRALQCLEQGIGREKVCEACETWFGPMSLQMSAAKTASVVDFRQWLNATIDKTMRA